MAHLRHKLLIMTCWLQKRAILSILLLCVFSVFPSQDNLFAQTTISPLTWTGQAASAAGASIFTALPASTTPASSAIVVSQWNRVGLTSGSAGSSYSSSGFAADATALAAQAGGKYLYFTVTNNSSTEVQVTQIYVASQISATGARNSGMLYQVGTGTINNYGSTVTTAHNAAAENWTFSGTVNICPGNTTTFYLCGFGTGTASTGTLRVNNGTAITAAYISSVSASTSSSIGVCTGDTLFLNGSATNGVSPYGYSWSGPASFSSTSGNTNIPSASSSVAGVYSLAVTDAYSCVATNTATVTVNPLPSAITGAGNVCVAGAATLSDLSTGGVWASDAGSVIGSTTGIVSGVTAGTSVITYILPTTCKITTTITIDPQPALITGPSDVCIGSTISLSDVTSGGTWSTGNTNLTIGSTSGIVNGIIAGAALVSYTGPNSCTITNTVTVDPLPTAIAGPGSVCAGASVTLSDGVPGGRWISASTTISVGSGSGMVTGVVGGTALITYIMPAGCLVTRTIAIVPSPAAISGIRNICLGSTITLSDVTSGGSWASGSASATIGSSSGIVNGASLGLAAISYIVPSGCMSTGTISVDPLPTPISGSTNVCVGATISLSDGLAGGSWISGNTNSAVGSATGFVSGISAGTSLITYMTPTGCMVTKSITVNPLPATISGSLSVCEGAIVTLTDATVGGSWNASSLNATIGSSNGIVNGIVAGSAIVSYSLPTGCLTTATITINATPAAVSGVSDICVGLSLSLSNTTPGGSWVAGNTNTLVGSASGVVTGAIAGTSVISYTLPNSCFAIGTVTVDPLPSTIAGPANVCTGATVTLTNTLTGGTWAISNANASIGTSTGAVTGNTVGTADITYTLPTGCKVIETISVDPTPATISGILTLCAGASATLSDPTPGGSWMVSNANSFIGTSSGIIVGLTAGTSVVSYVMPTGCFATATELINTLPSAIAGPSNVCIGVSATLTNTVAGGTWVSSNANATIGSTTGEVNGLTTGTTNVTYTLSTGCSATKTISVNVMPLGISGPGTVCVGSAISLSDPSAGGNWSASAGLLIGSASGIATGVTSGPATVSYTLNSGCFVATTVTVNAVPAGITGGSNVCVGNTLSLSSTSVGGTWASNNGNAIIGTSTGIVTGSLAGSSTISYTFSTGCATATVVNVNAVPGVISGVTQACIGFTTTLSDGTPGGTWSVSNANVTIGSVSGIVTAVTAGSSIVTYMVPSGCTATTTVIANTFPAAITGLTNVCIGSATTLSDLTAGGTWTSISTNVSVGSLSGAVSGISAGTASVSYTTSAGCTTTTTVTINSVPGAITGNTNICITVTTTLSNPGVGGAWSSSNGNVTIGSASGIAIGASAGTATIVYTNPAGCITFVTATVNLAPSAILGATAVCPGTAIALSDATTGGLWSSSNTNISVGSTSGLVSGITTGTSIVTYKLGATCLTTSTITIDPLPAAISGSSTVCQFYTTTLSDLTSGGTWAVSNANAAIGSVSGVVSGQTTGTATITYTSPLGCVTTTSITINPLPSAIIGSQNVCQGATATMTDPTVGGSWTASGSAAIGSVSGIVSGVTAGTSIISYTISTGCFSVDTIYINSLPIAHGVTGGGNYCAGDTGVHLGLNPTDTGVTYQLYNGTVAVGVSVAGTGASIDFGLYTAAGTYSVRATGTITGCSSTMSGSPVTTIVPVVVPSVTLSGGSGAICAGTVVNFTAIPVNGGTAPVYRWRINGILAGTTSSTYSYIPAAGDIVKTVLTSNAVCARPDTASATDTLNVTANQMPVATISYNPPGTICAGSSVTFTVSPTYGGSTPTYRWTVNSVAVGTGSSYTYSPTNTDFVYATMTSNFPCRLADSVFSNHLSMTVDPIVIPSLHLTATPGLDISAGISVTLTAVASGSGTSPVYVWFKNGTLLSGVTSATYTSSTYSNNDSVSCIIINPAPCGGADTAYAIIHVSSGVTATHGTEDLHLIPNPNDGNFRITGSTGEKISRDAVVQIFDLLGQTIFSTNAVIDNGNIDEQIKLNNLANGTYFVVLHTDSWSKKVSVIIHR